MCTQTTQMLCLKIRLFTHWRILVVVARRHQSAEHEDEIGRPNTRKLMCVARYEKPSKED